MAEDVEKLNPNLVVRDEKGRVNSVRYDAVNAMLLNEFLKEHKKVAKQQATIAKLKLAMAQQEKRFAQQEARIDAVTVDLQKVSAQIEMSRPAAKLFANHP